jgi:hypothetical protein
MLASTGTSTARTTASNSRRSSSASGKDHVRPGPDEGLGALHRTVQPRGGPDVGAGDHEEVPVPAGVDRRADALDGGGDVDRLLAVEVAAALGVDLVLDVAAGQPVVLEDLDGAGDVHRLAVAGVRVDQRGQVRHAGDLPGPVCHLGLRRQADVRQAEVGREHGTGDIHAVEAELLDQLRGHRVEGARQPQRLLGRGQPVAQDGPLDGGAGTGVQHPRSLSPWVGGDRWTVAGTATLNHAARIPRVAPRTGGVPGPARGEPAPARAGGRVLLGGPTLRE